MRSLLVILFVCFVIAHDVRATTWDEPWHDEVMRGSESFVKVKITANEGSVVKAEVIKFLAGKQTPAQIELRGYWRLTLGSVSSDTSELRLPFAPGQITSLSRSPTRQMPIKFRLQHQAGQVCTAWMSPPRTGIVFIRPSCPRKFMRRPCKRYSMVRRVRLTTLISSRNSRRNS